MSTTIRSELSEKNPYYLEKHRYYELKHFCLQYPFWQRLYLTLDGLSKAPKNSDFVKGGDLSDPTATCALMKTYYGERLDLVRQAALDTDPDIAKYILRAVTEGLSYTYLKTRLEIPCGKDMYYSCYRRFFWLLDKTRK